MRLPMLSRLLIVGLAGGITLAACGDGSGPSKDLTTGTFAVTPITFSTVVISNLLIYTQCVVPGFEFALLEDQGLLGVTYPDSLSLTCDGGNALPLYPTTPGLVGDSLEVAWTITPPPGNQTRDLMLRWLPGGQNLSGTAVLGLAMNAPEVTWVGTRQ